MGTSIFIILYTLQLINKIMKNERRMLMASQFLNSEYNIISDSEISSILSHFSPEMAFDTIDFILQNKSVYYSPAIAKANIINGYEMMFRQYLEQYPDYNKEFRENRDNLYRAIIDKICTSHNLSYNIDPGTDIFTLAFYLYQFLISDFSNYIIAFFTRYIIKEKTNIIEMIEAIDKNKNSSTSYSKKIYKGGSNKLSVIHSNLDIVLENIRGFDISLEDIINVVFENDKNLAAMLNSSIIDNGAFYKNFYVSFLNIHFPEMITSIRLQLQPPTSIDTSIIS